MEGAGFRVAARVRSFGYALAGLAFVVRTQHNAWIHGVATLLVLCAGWGFGLEALEWCLIILAITGVWAAEAMNTALEVLCDAVAPDPDERHPNPSRRGPRGQAGVVGAGPGGRTGRSLVS